MKKKKKRSILKIVKQALRQYELDNPTGFVRGGAHKTSKKDKHESSSNDFTKAPVDYD